MPDKLYQDCRALISGCRAIFEDLRETGVDTLPLTPVIRTVTGHPVGNIQIPTAQPQKPAAVETLSDIQQELAACRLCALSEQRAQTVFGTGNPNAQLVLVAAVPDAEEAQQGAPLVGEAGLLLDRILFAMKLTREEVYLCNVIKCRPASDREPEKSELAACETFLQRQLAAIAPEMIISLGGLASQTLLQTDESIAKLRGRWRSYAGIPVMPTFHPADLLENPAQKHQVWEDVKQVMHRLQDGEG